MPDSQIKTIDAEPEPISIELSQTAVVVVDMQNAFAKKGGYLDWAGHDISMTQKIIDPCRQIIEGCRQKGCKIVFFQMGCSPDLTETGPKGSPFNLKSKGLELIKQHPELKEKSYLYGTWGAEIIDELRPAAADIVIPKQRYDGFIGTNFHLVLTTFDIRHLIFIGTATNVCVESTLRHAFFLDYFPILVSDAVSALGPGMLQEATLYNVRSRFGWVTTSEKLLNGI